MNGRQPLNTGRYVPKRAPADGNRSDRSVEAVFLHLVHHPAGIHPRGGEGGS